MVAVLSVGVATAAWAYFTSHGSGTGSGKIATLAKPTAVTGTPSSSTVAVSWTGITFPTGGTSGYYVMRTPSPSGSPSNACGSSPSSLLATTATTCNDTSV